MQMSIGRETFKYSRNFQIELIVATDGFSYRVFVPEVFLGNFFGEHQGKRSAEDGFWISLQDFGREHVKKIGVRKKHIVFIEQLFPIPHWSNAVGEQAGHFLDVREIVEQVGAKWRRYRAEIEGYYAILVVETPGYPVDAVRLRIKPVITQFVQQIGKDQQATSQSNGKAK